MRFNHDTIFPAKGFSTPPAPCLKSPNSFPAMPMSERKSNPLSACRRDLFHVVHKVPAGDSPYGRAKHVQLVEKDPSRAIALFWAAINAGDRVDSALKDMAVVMKQLNRSDEAIEAIKSFRHLCPYESQESLDNVLVELYKRSGRIEEEIEMLHRKLKIVDEGIAFGGKRTKIARSQGKKIQITVEQERSRILGNLAWAYMQHHDYGLAENFYRNALALEPDNNKKCNLALCLMHMNRIAEAKSLLQNVKASLGTKEMDESCMKSFDRAVQMLTEIESRSVVKPTEDNNWWKPNRSWSCQEQQSTPVLHTQPRNVSETRQTNYTQEHNSVISGQQSTDNAEISGISDANVSGPVKPTGVNEGKPGLVKCSNHKSWADMVEEEERRLQTGENLSPCFDGWSDEGSNNENRDSNIVYQSQGGKSPASLRGNGALDTVRSVRRSLFDGNKNRLRVFREITQS